MLNVDSTVRIGQWPGNKIEIDAGMVTLRQPLGHERRPARSNGW